MIRNGERVCDQCGQKIPAGAKLFAQSQAAEGAADLCLNCRIRNAEVEKGRGT